MTTSHRHVAALGLLVLVALVPLASAITQLRQGDIALVQFGSIAGQDKLTLVTLLDLDAGTSFKVTDRGWNARYTDTTTGVFDANNVFSSFTDTVSEDFEESVGEGTITYTAATAIPAGTLIEWVEGGTNAGWTGTAGNLFQNGGDQVIVYRGDAPMPCFIWAWTNVGQGGFEDTFKVSGGFIDGDAKDNELDSDYPYNFYDAASDGFNFNTLVGQDVIKNAVAAAVAGGSEYDFMDGGSGSIMGTCGLGAGEKVTWPELPLAATYTYTGPLTGTKSFLAAALSNEQYFSSKTGADAPAPITSALTVVEAQPTTFTNDQIANNIPGAPKVFDNNKILPIAITTGTPEEEDGTGAGIQTTFRLAVLDTIPAGSEIFVTDRGVKDDPALTPSHTGDPSQLADLFYTVENADGDPESGEGTLKFTPTTDVVVNSVIEFTGDTTGEWSVVEGELEFTTGGDNLVVYTFDYYGRRRVISQTNTGSASSSATPNAAQTNIITEYLDPETDTLTTGTGFKFVDLTSMGPPNLVTAQSLYYNGADLSSLGDVSGLCADLVDDILMNSFWGTMPPATAINSLTVGTTLSTNGLRLTYIKSSNDDKFNFMLLEPIVTGTQITFQDRNGGKLLFTAAMDYPAGSTIEFDVLTDLAAANEWARVTGPSFSLDPTSDVIDVHQGMGTTYITSVDYGTMPNSVSGLDEKAWVRLDGNDLEHRGPRTGTVDDLRRALLNEALWFTDANDSPSVTTPFSIVDTCPGTELAVGDIAIVYVENDGDPTIHLLSLVEIAAGTEFFLTDMSFEGDDDDDTFFVDTASGSVTNEGTLKFTATGTVPPGTVLKVRANGQAVGTGIPGTWELIRGEIAFTPASGDQLFVFQAKTVNPGEANEFLAQFIWAMDWTSDGATVNNANEVVAGDAATAVNGFANAGTATHIESYIPFSISQADAVQLPGRNTASHVFSILTFFGGVTRANDGTVPTAAYVNTDIVDGHIGSINSIASNSGTREQLLYNLRTNTYADNIVSSDDIWAVGVDVSGDLDPATWLLESASTSAVIPAMEFSIQTSLGLGDAIIVNAVDGTTTDLFQILLMKDVVAMTELKVTDSGWDSGSMDFRDAEGVWTYTVPAGGHPAGTIISGNSDGSGTNAAVEDRTAGTFDFDFVVGDQAILYQEGPESPSFIFALHMDSTVTPAFGYANTDVASDLPSGLAQLLTGGTDEFGAVVLHATGDRAFEYRGPRAGTPQSIAIAASNNRFWYKGASVTTQPATNAFNLMTTDPAQPTQLKDGDVMIVRAEQMGTSFTVDVVPLVTLTGGTCFHVTNADTDAYGEEAFESEDIFTATEAVGTIEYCAPGGGIAAGTVLTYPGDSGFRITEPGLEFTSQLTVFQWDMSLVTDADLANVDVEDIAKEAEEILSALYVSCTAPATDDETRASTCLADGSGDSEVYTGPLTGDKPGLIEAIENHLFWRMSTITQTSVGDLTLTLAPPSQPTKLSAGDVVVVSYEQSSASDMFQLLPLVDIAEGTTLCVTDNAAITTEDTDDGVSCFTTPAGGVSAGTLIAHPSSDWTVTADELSLAATEVFYVFQYDLTELDPVVPLWQFDALADDTGAEVIDYHADTAAVPSLLFNGMFTSLFVSQGPNWVYRGPTTGNATSLRNAVASYNWWTANGGDVSSELTSFDVIDPETAPTAGLQAGCASIVRVQMADTIVVPNVPAEFDLVVLEDVAEGSVIYVSTVDWVNDGDAELAGAPFDADFDQVFGETDATGEGIVAYTVGAGGLTAGTVIPWTATSTDWTNVYGSLDLPLATSAFLNVLQFDPLSTDVGSPIDFLWGWRTDAAADFPSTLVTGVTEPRTTDLGGNTDPHHNYFGPTVGNKADLMAAISMSMYWSEEAKSTPLTDLPSQQPDFVIGLGSTTELAAGDVAIVRVETDTASTNDEFEFVFLKDVAAGTQIFFTDQGWVTDSMDPNTGSFLADSDDGVLRYTVPAGGLTAGTVVTYAEADIAMDPTFVMASGNFNLETEDQILAFTATANPTFLWMYDFTQNGIEELPADVLDNTDTNQPPSLVGFTTTLLPYEMTQMKNDAVYVGPSKGDAALIQAALINPMFWKTDIMGDFDDVTDFDVGAALGGTALTAGDVAVVEVFSSGTLTWKLVALCELAQGTEFYMTDYGWAETSFFMPAATETAVQEGMLFFNATDAAIPAGTVIAETDTGVSTLTAPLDFNTGMGDQLFIFQWRGAGPTFVWGWDNTGAWEAAGADVTDETKSTQPAGLGSQSAIILPFAPDYTYTGPTDASKSVLQTAIAQGTNIAPPSGRRLYTTFWLSGVTTSGLPSLFNINAVLTVTELAAGCVAVVSYTANSFQLLLLDGIGPGTELYVTDNGFLANNVAGFTNGNDDGTIKYTATATLPAGTLLTWDAINPAAEWSAVEAGFDPEADDQLIVFQYYNSPTPTFLWGLDLTGAWETMVTDLTSNTESEAPTVAPYQTVLASGVASAVYGGTVAAAPTSGTKNAMISAINDPTNWQTDGMGVAAVPDGGLTVETTLSECDVAVVGYFPGDSVQLLVLQGVAEGTRVFATSRGWDGSAFFSSAPNAEGTANYTAPAGGAPAGTLITLDTSGEGWPLAAGDTVLVYQGLDEDTPLTFLWAYATSAFSTVQSSATTQLPASLGVCNTTRLSPAAAAFDGPASAEKMDFQYSIADPANWVETTSPLAGPFVVQHQTLAPGCVAVVNFHSHEVLDQLQLLVVENMAQDATFYVTDSGWSANGFISHPQDCILQFTAQAPLTAGTVITWTESRTTENAAAGWSVLQCPNEGFKLTNEGESLLVYHAPSSSPTMPTTFLWGFKNSGDWDTAAPTATTNLETYSTLPDSIIEFNTALVHFDNYKYKGVMCGEKEVVVQTIASSLFWYGDNDDSPTSEILTEAFAADAFQIGTCETTTLEPGCVVVVEYQADVNGGTVEDGTSTAFKLLVLEDILKDTTIFVTDGAWDNTDADFTLEEMEFMENTHTETTTDGMLRYVFPADVPAGTIITWEDGAANVGWESCGTGAFDLNPRTHESLGGDQILVFAAQGMSFPTFLFGMDTTRTKFNPPGWEADLTDTDAMNDIYVNVQSELPTGLVDEVALTSDFLNYVYTGPTTGTKESLSAAIGTYGNNDIQTSVFWLGTEDAVTSLPASAQLPTSFTIGDDGQQALNPGDILIVEFDVDTGGSELVTFLTTVDIAAGTAFCVTDKDWVSDTAGWRTDQEGDDDVDHIDEGTVCYTASADIPKGSLIEWTAMNTAAEWETTDEGFVPAVEDGLFVFQWRAADTEPRHIWAYVNEFAAQGIPAVLSTNTDTTPAFQYSTKDGAGTQRHLDHIEHHASRTPSWLAAEVHTPANWDAGSLDALTAPLLIQTELNAGDVAIIAYRPGVDETTTTYLQFLLTVDVCKGTQFIVTNVPFLIEDSTTTPGLTTLGFDGGNGEAMVFIAQADLQAGTVLTYGGPDSDPGAPYIATWLTLDDLDTTGFAETGASEFDSDASGQFSLGMSGNTVYIMQWTTSSTNTDDAFEVDADYDLDGSDMDLPVNLIWATDATDDGFDAQSMTAAEGALPTALIGFSTALNMDDYAGKYTGSFLGSREDVIDRITDLANWSGGVVDECQDVQACNLFGSPLSAGVTLGVCESARLGNDMFLSGMVQDTSTTTSVTIDWGDGSATESIAVADMQAGPPGTMTAVFVASHAYAATGDYTVTVTAVDGVVGNVDPADSKTVTVTDAAPPAITFVMNPMAVNETQVSALSGTVVDPTMSGIWRRLASSAGRRLSVTEVIIDWGDGSPLETVPVNPDGSFSATHTYPDDGGASGSWSATVTATNVDGTTTVSLPVVVNNLPPKVELTMPAAIPQYGTVSLSGTVSDPNPADTFKMLVISWGDGTTSTFTPLDTSHPGLTFNSATGEFTATHMYTDPSAANTFVIQAQVFDDDMSPSPWDSTSVDIVPECSVSGGLTLAVPLSCGSVAFDMLTHAQLTELKEQLIAVLTDGTPVVLDGSNIVIMSLICNSASGGSDVIVTFRVLGLSDADAIAVAAVLSGITSGSNSAANPLLPFVITGTFGLPVTECPLCDASCVTCTDVSSSSCSSCPDGYMLAGAMSPAACVPNPSTTSSPSASPSTSTTGSGSVTPSSTPSASFGAVGGAGSVGGASITEGQQAGGGVAAPSSAVSESPSASAASAASASTLPSTSTSESSAASMTPSMSASETAAAAGGADASVGGPASGGNTVDDGGSSNTTLLVAAVGGGVVVGIVVVAGIGVLYVRAKRRAGDDNEDNDDMGSDMRRRGSRRPRRGAPPPAPSTLWRVMHTPPASRSRGASLPDSPA